MAFLEGAAAGRILAIVVHDSGSGVRVNLAPYGSTITTALGFRESYAMITQKGPKPSWFVERKSAIRAGPTIVEAYIPVVVDGGWSVWGPWSGCSVTCGVGTQTRDRTCTNPAPQNGGADCDGPAQETQACDTGVSCPVDGGWSDWSSWSGCIGICEVERQNRYRTCTNPAPANGGADCVGPTQETQQCPIVAPCPVCQKPLGVESGAIPNARITASSNAIFRPSYYGRLRKLVVNWGGWSPTFYNIGQWLQVDLGEIKRVTGTVTQGAQWSIAPNSEPWVTSHKLEYSGDGIFWTTYADSDGSDKVFTGNTDKNTIKKNLLDNPIDARYVRFYPQSWSTDIAMRVEILGCRTHLLWGLSLLDAGPTHLTVSWTVVGNLPIKVYRLRYQPADGSGPSQDLSPAPFGVFTSATVSGLQTHTEYTLTLTSFDWGNQQNGEITGTFTTVCQYPLGMESYAIPDSSITASGIQSPSRYQPYFARLKRVLGWGGWAPAINGVGQWLQVDLGEMKHITGIVTQGGWFAQYDRWVTTYKLQYSTDGTVWTTYADGGSDKVFLGNTDNKTPVTNLLDSPVDARYVRFYPQTWNDLNVMRVEILGCTCPGDKATCIAWGDPHYITFDGKDHHFQGPCRYTFAKDCGSSNDFNIEVQQVPTSRNPSVSRVREVYVTAHGYEIGIRLDKTVTVTGPPPRLSYPATPPFSLANGKIQVTLSGTFVRVELTELCVVILFGGRFRAEVKIPSSYQNKMCGLCGNYNGVETDDFENPNGNIASDIDDFGNSWLTNSNTCPAGTSTRRKRQTEEPCDAIYSDPCNVLNDSNGTFAACHDVVDPQIHFESCVFDECATQAEGGFLCANLEAYYATCRLAGVPAFTWRTSDLCPLDCPANSTYSPCTTACPATCVNPNAPDQCNLPCVEGCGCDAGYVMSGLDCVPETDCGCASNNGYYYTVGAVWVYDGEECVCNGRDTIVCTGTGGFIVRAVSTGREDPGTINGEFRNRSYIVSNGQEIRVHQNVHPYERGHQAFILNERTGEVIDKAVFDTHEGGTQAAGQLMAFLEGAAAGRILAIVVHDSGSGVRVNLAPYGSTITTALGFRESYAMITQKGPKPSWFVERKSAIRAGPTIVEAYIPVVVDGGWSVWGPWSGCSVTCGVGTQTRDRTCTNPAPQNGGADCDGPAQETQACDTGVSCPVDGGWSDWSSWSGCIGICEVERQNRYRTCTNPAPANGGADCVGPTQETQQCPIVAPCPVCQKPLGVESGAIPNARITASSNAIFRPSYYGRLRKLVVNWGGWSPTFYNIGQWLQVDLGEIKRVTGTVTQGAQWSIAPNSEPWVTSHKLEYSGDGIFWTTYADSDGSDKVFTGNTDKNTIKKNLLDNPIDARYVRFYPQSWSTDIAMRVEILGCRTHLLWGLSLLDAGPTHLTVSWTVVGNLPIKVYRLRYQPADGSGPSQDLSPAPFGVFTSATVSGLQTHTEYTLTLTSFDWGNQQNGEITGTFTTVCQYPLGMESYAIPDSSITASGIQSPSRYQPYFARLKRVLGWGGWAPAINGVGQWLQVDLGEMKHITGIVTQGGWFAQYDRWVTTYKLQYSTDGTVWTTYADGGSDKVFLGNTDNKTPVTNLLDSPVDARYVRFYPQTWNDLNVMRVEILGCTCPGDKATCIAWGDPHYITFDGKDHHFQGPCRYTFAKDCGSSNDFNIEVQQVPTSRNPSVSRVREVYVTAHGYEIGIRLDKTVTVTGPPPRLSYPATPPFSLANGKIQVTLSGTFVRVELTELCVVILFGGRFRAEVKIPSSYQNKMCGLCGNYNGVETDDFENPNGNIASDIDDFGNSWLTNSNTCPAGTSTRRKRQTEEPCDAIYSDPCNVLNDSNGTFAACHDVVDPQIHFESCVFDECATQAEGGFLCANLEAYYATCRLAGVPAFTWRTSDLCPLDCPANSTYSPCTTACPATCVNPNAPDQCNLPCVEGCGCDAGYVMSGLDCVPETDCGCASNNGYYYTVGASWVYEGEECVCNGRDTIDCTGKGTT
ncbi:zonadhesin-like [Branchiostoma floridae x Branchiostoma belcheri]